VENEYLLFLILANMIFLFENLRKLQNKGIFSIIHRDK